MYSLLFIYTLFFSKIFITPLDSASLSISLSVSHRDPVINYCDARCDNKIYEFQFSACNINLTSSVIKRTLNSKCLLYYLHDSDICIRKPIPYIEGDRGREG